jgi:hypothetical protein
MVEAKNVVLCAVDRDVSDAFCNTKNATNVKKHRTSAQQIQADCDSFMMDVKRLIAVSSNPQKAIDAIENAHLALDKAFETLETKGHLFVTPTAKGDDFYTATTPIFITIAGQPLLECFQSYQALSMQTNALKSLELTDPDMLEERD